MPSATSASMTARCRCALSRAAAFAVDARVCTPMYTAARSGVSCASPVAEATTSGPGALLPTACARAAVDNAPVAGTDNVEHSNNANDRRIDSSVLGFAVRYTSLGEDDPRHVTRLTSARSGHRYCAASLLDLDEKILKIVGAHTRNT